MTCYSPRFAWEKTGQKRYVSVDGRFTITYVPERNVWIIYDVIYGTSETGPSFKLCRKRAEKICADRMIQAQRSRAEP